MYIFTSERYMVLIHKLVSRSSTRSIFVTHEISMDRRVKRTWRTTIDSPNETSFCWCFTPNWLYHFIKWRMTSGWQHKVIIACILHCTFCAMCVCYGVFILFLFSKWKPNAHISQVCWCSHAEQTHRFNCVLFDFDCVHFAVLYGPRCKMLCEWWNRFW